MLSVLSSQVRSILRDHPEGLNQADIAAHLGIPRTQDNNWITYYVLKHMLQDGQVVKTDQKKFFCA